MAGGRRLTVEQRWVLGLASVASFMISLDSLVVATALSTIHKSLNAALSSLEWTVNGYNLAFAVLLLTGAALGDRFGRKRMFIGGLALFTLASTACALAPNVGALIAARAVQGAGAAVLMPLALTQLSAAVPPQLRGKALGIFSGVTGLATFLGPFVGGAISQGLAWEWIFWLNIPIGAVAIVLVTVRIKESTGPNNRFDLLGLLLATCGGFGLVWGLIRGNSVGWRSGEVLVALILGGILIIAFAYWETLAKSPMLPMRFFRLRAFTTANVSNFCLCGSLYGTLFLLAQYLQNGLGYGPFDAGLRLMPWTATLMVCGPIAGALADKFGERPFMVTGLLLDAAGMGWLAMIAKADSSYASLVPALVVGGCGLSMALPAAQKSVVGAVNLPEIGQASAAISTLRIFAGVFGIAILSAVFVGHGGGYASPQAFANGFAPAIDGGAIMALIGAAVGLGMRGRNTPPAQAGAPAATQPQATRSVTVVG